LKITAYVSGMQITLFGRCISGLEESGEAWIAPPDDPLSSRLGRCLGSEQPLRLDIAAGRFLGGLGRSLGGLLERGQLSLRGSAELDGIGRSRGRLRFRRRGLSRWLRLLSRCSGLNGLRLSGASHRIEHTDLHEIHFGRAGVIFQKLFDRRFEQEAHRGTREHATFSYAHLESMTCRH
jgi:hypothetical protein